MYRDYRDKDVQFYYVYKAIQHPEINNFVSAFSIQERVKHIAEAKRLMQTEIPWICDSMDNQVKLALGSAPNGEFIIDPEGKIVRKRFWSNPKNLRSDLVELVGTVEKITTVDDLPTKLTVEPKSVASGVVPRLSLPGGLTPVKLTPHPDDEHPFFAKLRVEATKSLLQEGKGQMYLGVNLDPLYKVHWNNPAGNVEIKIEAPEGVTFSETALKGPDVKEEADIDPRQFLIDVDRGDSKEPIDISLTYTACDDAGTFCLTMTQKYTVELEKNRHGGTRPGIFMPEMFANVKRFDENEDGNLTKDELPVGEVTLYIGHMDFNGNEIIEQVEIETFMKMFNNGRGFDSPLNDGDQSKQD